MKVAIFETQHAEAAFPVIKLFDNGKNELTIFSYEEAYQHLKYLLRNDIQRFNWVIRKKQQSKISFILTILKETRKQKIKLLYLNTITNNFIFYALMIFLLKKVRVIVTIHSINNFFDHRFSFHPRRLIRTIGKKLLIAVTKEFNVISTPSVKYLESKLPKNKKVHCVPNAVFDEQLSRQTQPPVTECIHIVIPGTVEKRRRNYDQVFDLMIKLTESKIPFAVTLLGKLYQDYGQEIMAKAKKWNAQYDNVRYYENDEVNQLEFDRVISTATLLFLPLEIETIVDDDIVEICGTSSTSGNITEVIRHSKPFIIPKLMAIDPVLEKACFRYNNPEEIVSFISSLWQNPGFYLSMLDSSLDASQNFTVNKIRSRIGAVLEE